MKLVLLDTTGPVWTAALTGRVEFSGFVTGDPFPRTVGSFARRLALDVSGVVWLDSAAVGWLLASTQRFAEAGGKLVLHSLPPVVSNLLVGVLRLDDRLALAADLEAALRVAVV